MSDLLSKLPSLRPGEIGQYWFAKASADIDGDSGTIGKAKLTAGIGELNDDEDEVDLVIGDDNTRVEMFFTKRTDEIIPEGAKIGASREGTSRLVINYWECD